MAKGKVKKSASHVLKVDKYRKLDHEKSNSNNDNNKVELKKGIKKKSNFYEEELAKLKQRNIGKQFKSTFQVPTIQEATFKYQQSSIGDSNIQDDKLLYADQLLQNEEINFVPLPSQPTVKKQSNNKFDGLLDDEDEEEPIKLNIQPAIFSFKR